MKRYLYLITFFVACILISSCATDHHYANSFLRKHKWGTKAATEKIYVHVPKTLIHTNSSLNQIEDFDQLTYEQQDSVIASLTKVLDKIDDSIFLSQFTQMLCYTLAQTHIPILIVDEEKNLPAPSKDCLILDICEIEAEEFVKPSRSDFYTRRGVYFNYDYDLRHFATNVWLQLNYDTNYYYYDIVIAEDFKGTVTKLKGDEAQLKGNFSRITVNEAYQSARTLAVQIASLYIEKCLHEYVYSKKGKNTWYWYYNYMNNQLNLGVPFEEGCKDGFKVVGM